MQLPANNAAPPENNTPSDDLLRVLEISRQLALTTDLQSLLKEIENAVLTVLDCERATVLVYDKASDELFSCVSSRSENVRLPINSGIAGACFKGNILLNIPDAYQDERFNQTIDHQTGFKTRNMLACPLSVSGQDTLGVLEVLNKSDGCFDTHDETLLQTFAAQSAIAIHRQFLMEEFGEHKRLQSELAIAKTIQKGLFPSTPPVVAGFDIAGWNKPAEETGGDFFDFQILDDEKVLFVIADVAGHGIGPALLAAECSALQRAVFSLVSDLQTGLAHVNRLLCAHFPSDRFVTAFVGLLSPSDDRLAFISAGHGPVLIYRARTGKITELPVNGLPLGVLSDTSYESLKTIRLEPGDSLIALTDGFTEWENGDEVCFGLERVYRVIQDNPDIPATELIDKLYRTLLVHVQNAKQNDDLTAIVIKKNR